MFDLYKNQVVGFYYQNVWKTPVEEWHFNVSLLQVFSNILVVKTNYLVYP